MVYYYRVMHELVKVGFRLIEEVMKAGRQDD